MTWAEWENELSDAVDATFAEDFEFRPMRQLTVNDRVEPDPDRSIKAFVGIFGAPASDHTLISGRPARTHVLGGDGQGRVTMQQPSCSADERQFTAGEIPKQGDRLYRAEDSSVYSINDVQPDGQGRLVFVLVHITTE